ncbi:hypothetical protein ACH4VS_33055 [Streptomyces hygroscopicus]|uniref:hypothetical protein n=1 Tax=Streptomyces hygroscopicus TaxID=1912 RepID=UPI000767794A|nr:hypothetical protein [Streptomyces hygroscopicus]GLV78265.1 hypothetical protein Shyhy02_62650 [Streptomyces hygroscopicus subsp. hygroscopicus]
MVSVARSESCLPIRPPYDGSALEDFDTGGFGTDGFDTGGFDADGFDTGAGPGAPGAPGSWARLPVLRADGGGAPVPTSLTISQKGSTL